MIFLAIAISAGMNAATPPVVDISTLDNIIQQPSIQSAQLAADGDLIYVLDGTRKLHVYQTDTLREIAGPLDWPRTIFSFYPTKLRGVIAGLEVGGGPPRVIVHDVLAPGADNSKTIALPGRIAGFANPQGDDIRVLTQGSDGAWKINRIDAGSGSVTSESLPSRAQDFAFAPGNQPVAAMTVASSGNEWSRLACRADSCQDLVPIGRPGAEGVINGLSDGSGLNVWMRTGEGTKAPALWAWNEATPQLLASIPGADVSDVLVDPETGRIQAFAGGVFDRRWQAIDPELAPVLARIEGKVAGFPQVLDRSRDGAKWLIADISDERPPVVWLYLANSDELVRLPGQADIPAVPSAKDAFVKARDGLSVPVYLSPPVDSACNPQVTDCGLVALIHGGPQRRDERQFSPEVALLQQMGLWVLRVNYRGSDGFGEQFVAWGNGEWGRRISHDVIDSLHWAASQKGVDDKRMCIVGESFGGFTAINVASLRPDLVACAVSLNGGGDLERFAVEVIKRRPEMASGLSRQLGNPETRAGLLHIRDQSPMSRLDALQAMPLLLAYGSADDVTPTVQTTGLVDALAARQSRSYVLLEFPGESHILGGAAQRHYRAALANFLAKNIGARASIAIDDIDHAPHVTGAVELIANSSVSGMRLTPDVEVSRFRRPLGGRLPDGTVVSVTKKPASMAGCCRVTYCFYSKNLVVWVLPKSGL